MGGEGEAIGWIRNDEVGEALGFLALDGLLAQGAVVADLVRQDQALAVVGGEQVVAGRLGEEVTGDAVDGNLADRGKSAGGGVDAAAGDEEPGLCRKPT